jgi:hypothetical protein
VATALEQPYEELKARLAQEPCVATISFPGWRQLEVPVDDCVG